jgi:hypothetical protein
MLLALSNTLGGGWGGGIYLEVHTDRRDAEVSVSPADDRRKILLSSSPSFKESFCLDTPERFCFTLCMEIAGVIHEITITEPTGEGTPNFIVRCSCGRKINVACRQTDRSVPESIGERHLEEEQEAYERSLDDSGDEHEPFNLFGDPDFQMDSRRDREMGCW